MNKQELNQWLKDYPAIDWSDIDYDQSDNKWYQSYHKVGDEYYSLPWLNKHPLEVHSKGKGYLKDTFIPTKVIRNEETVTVVRWNYSEDPDKEEIDLDSIDWDD